MRKLRLGEALDRLRILNLEPLGYSAEAAAVLSGLGEVDDGPLDRDGLLERVPACDVLIVRLAHRIDREVIDAGNRLKAVVSATTGLDHIDVKHAERRGVRVLSLRDEKEFLRTINATPEHTWALLLSLIRRIPGAFESVRRGQWDRDAYRGTELDGKRLGLLGLGRVASRVARYGLAFGMEVVAHAPYFDQWPESVDRSPTIAGLLRRSQVLSLHVPLNAETTGMIGAKELALLPEGALLVNTARGELLDEEALVSALESGHLAGSALDVVSHERDQESRTKSHLLAYARHHDNLLITPHVAGGTHESMARTEVFMARKLEASLESLMKGRRRP